MKTGSLAPLEAKWSVLKVHLEPVFGGFLRVWSIGGKFAEAPCARARAQARRCIISLHSSISSKRDMEIENNILRVLGFSGDLQMEPCGYSGSTRMEGVF